MDLEVVTTLIFFFVTKFTIMGKKKCHRQEYFYFSSPKYGTHNSRRSYQRSSDSDLSCNYYYYFVKKNACQMIWWRPRMRSIIQPYGCDLIELSLTFSCMPTKDKVLSPYFHKITLIQARG